MERRRDGSCGPTLPSRASILQPCGNARVRIDGVSNADALVASIRAGEVAAVQQLVRAEPALASAPLGGAHGLRTALHVVTDWPGYYENGPAMVGVLLAAGADVSARMPGKSC